MLLAIDIGNSNIVFGVFKGKRLVEKRSVPTKVVYSLRKCSAEICRLPHRGHIIEDIIVSSVVPNALVQLERILKRVFKKRVLVLGRDLQAPIKNLYRRPQQVGQDRLINGVAASVLYNKDKKKNIVVIDFGTAVTFDVISKRNEYLGGLIFPGIRLSLETLYKRAALLPKVEIKRPRSLIGKDTKDSMRSGLLNGYASLCDGVVERISRLYGRVKVVATGGDAKLVARYADCIERIEPDLTLKGLQITHEKIS